MLPLRKALESNEKYSERLDHNCVVIIVYNDLSLGQLMIRTC